MLERQREGIAKAKAEGKYKGRPAAAAKQWTHRAIRIPERQWSGSGVWPELTDGPSV